MLKNHTLTIFRTLQSVRVPLMLVIQNTFLWYQTVPFKPEPKKIEEAFSTSRHCTSHFRECLVFVVSPIVFQRAYEGNLWMWRWRGYGVITENFESQNITYPPTPKKKSMLISYDPLSLIQSPSYKNFSSTDTRFLVPDYVMALSTMA